MSGVLQTVRMPDLCAMCGVNPSGGGTLSQNAMNETPRNLRTYGWTVPICPSCREVIAARRKKKIVITVFVIALLLLPIILWELFVPRDWGPSHPLRDIFIFYYLILLLAGLGLGFYAFLARPFSRPPRLSKFNGFTFEFTNTDFAMAFARLNPDMIDVDTRWLEAEEELRKPEAAPEEKEPVREVAAIDFGDYLTDGDRTAEVTYDKSPELQEANSLVFQESKLQEGIDRLRAIADANPDSGAPKILLAQALMSAGEIDSAESLMVEAYERTAPKSDAANMLGILMFEKRHDLERSFEWHLRSIYAQRLEPCSWGSYLYLAGVFTVYDMTIEAVELKKAADEIRGFSVALKFEWIQQAASMKSGALQPRLITAWESFLREHVRTLLSR